MAPLVIPNGYKCRRINPIIASNGLRELNDLPVSPYVMILPLLLQTLLITCILAYTNNTNIGTFQSILLMDFSYTLGAVAW